MYCANDQPFEYIRTVVKNAILIGEGISLTLTIWLWVNMIPKSKDSINHDMEIKLKP